MQSIFTGNLELGLYHMALLVVGFLVERQLLRTCLLTAPWYENQLIFFIVAQNPLKNSIKYMNLALPGETSQVYW